VEKKTPEGSNLKPVVKPTPSVAPTGVEKPRLAEPEKKPSSTPAVEKQVKRPPPSPAPHAAGKPHCGKPDEPKC
jgi:hypothetical protein